MHHNPASGDVVIMAAFHRLKPSNGWPPTPGHIQPAGGARLGTITTM